jgi:hypothetical protein
MGTYVRCRRKAQWRVRKLSAECLAWRWAVGVVVPFPLRDICRDDPLPEVEHIRVVWIDRDLNPMMVGVAECLDAGEIFERRKIWRAPNSLRAERLV